VQRHPALRWLVPFGVVCLAGLAVVTVVRERASSAALPQAVPAALVSDVQHNQDTGFSGTVVSQLSLGLPALYVLPALSRRTGGASFNSLLDGSHTMQVWYGGRDRQRVALLGAGEETDLFRNGSDLWQWSSSDGVALHTKLRHDADVALDEQPPEALTPASLAAGALSALDPDTALSVDDEVTVADRRAYELVLTPHSDATKIGSVHVAIDGATKVPLGVQIYPKGSTSAAIDVAFTSIRFGMPAERNFQFVPPANATVSKLGGELSGLRTPAAAIAAVTGSGWTTVYRLHAGPKDTAHAHVAADAFRAMSQVSGHWGKGRLVESPMLSMLVTKDGRVFAGAVRPARLYAVAAKGAKQ
jgi:outer membrane lipoprotein-sorting protein